MTPEEQRRWLIANGYDPEQYELVSPLEAEKRETTAAGALGTGFKSSIGGTIGGVVGAATPLALMSGPLGWGALGLSALGGLAGGYLGSKGQEAAEDAALDDAEQQALSLQRQAAYEKYPWLTFAGQAAPSMAFFRPSPTVLKNVFGAVKNAPLGTQTALQRYALSNVAVGGGVEAGVDLGVQAMSDEDINWGRVAGAGLLGGLLTEPTRAFGKVGATISRSGLDSKAWLDEKGMLRPLTEIEAAEVAVVKGREHKAAVYKNRAETDKAVIEYSATKDARKLLKKSDYPTRAELLEAEKQAGRDVENTLKTFKEAESANARIKEQSEKILKDNPLAHEVRQIRAKTQKLQKAFEEAQARHTEALETRAALKKQLADLIAKTAKAKERAEDRDKRFGKGKTEPKPADAEYHKAVQGLMAKQGMTMNEAVADLKGRDDKGTFKIKGEYDTEAHAATLNTLHDDDTPWHEYLHGIVQVLKRSLNPKHRRLIEHIESGMFKEDPYYKKMVADGKSLAERTAWAEEQIVQRGGKILEKRMSNPPEGFIGGLKKWFSDWRLERDAATGFTPKYTDKKSIDAEEVLNRMADWMAMRGERAPALQPKQVDALLADLVVKSPYDNFGPVLGRSRYARDVGSDDEFNSAQFDNEWQDTELRLRDEFDVRPRNVKLPELPEDMRAYVHDYMVERLHQYKKERRTGTRILKRGKLVTMDEKEHNHQDAFAVASEATERFTGRTAKDEADSLTPPTLMELFEDQLRLRSGDEPSKLQSSNLLRIALHKYANFLQKNSDYTPPWMRFQRVNAKELNGALKVVAMHDTSVQYSKRVRANMMKRIKAGTYTVEQGQKALARFASKPFPAEMSGEEIAQVVNGMEMYHGSSEADTVRREGFKGEELSQHSNYGRGIYMTHIKKDAAHYGGLVPIRTNFKNILDLDSIQADPQAFRDSIITKGREMGRDVIESSVYRRMKDANRQLPNTTRQLVTSADVALGGNINTVLRAMGYDGLTITQLNRATNLYSREVVAFREPFDAATDQLHEYYGGKRLQRMDADEYLGDVKDYQLTSYTDHFSSNPAAKRPWFLDSIVDRIRMTGESSEERRASSVVANAMNATARDAQTLDGQFIQNFELVEQGNVKLSAAEAEHVQIYMAHARRTDPETGELVHPIPAETLAKYNEPDSVVKHYVEWFRDQYTESRKLDIEAGLKVYHPKTGELTEPGAYREYSPEILNQTKWRELSGNDAAKRDAAKKELSDWWKTHRVQDETHKNYISDDEIKEAVDAYVARLAGNDMAHLGSTKFGALRKAEGIGLPLTKDADGRFNWIEPSAANTFTSYFRRWSKDHSFFKNMEQNPDVRSILGIKDPKTGEHVPTYATGKNPFHVETTTLKGYEVNKAQTSDKNVRDFIKGYLGYYEGDELFGRTANRLVVSHWLGLMSGARDLGSSYVFSLPHLRGRDMGLMISSLKDFSRSWIQSHLYGVNKTHANRIEFSTETHNKLADVANRWSDIVSKYSGRTPLERITRTAQFGLGRAVVLKHMGVAKGTDITVDRNMRRLGEMSGVDVEQLRRHADKADEFTLDDKTLDDALDRMAASWVEGNQGTYDVRGVPSWTMSGSMSMFTSLARWNIEKFNTMRREIVRPAMDEGDWRPFIKATLGSVFTGTLLIELSELINNKFRANPTLEEAVREGDEEEIAYAVADSLNYAGYFGVASALGNDMMNFARGQRPQGAGIVFPAWDFLSQSLTEPIFDAVTAIEEGEDPLPTIFEAIHETIRNTHQTYRIMWNNDMLGLLPLGRERVNEQNIRRDLRIFRRFEGIRGAAPVGGLGNRMLRPKTREFKEADTVEEAIEALPEAFEEQRRRAKGRGDKLKSYTQGLYAIPDKTMPSPDTVEGAQEFLRYREYLTRQEGWFSARGDRYWQRIFNEWVRNKTELTPAKKLLVKSYVQHLIKSPSTSRP